jgi:hypothetical protein
MQDSITKQYSSSKVPNKVNARAFHVAQALGLVPHEDPDDVLVGEVGLPGDHLEHLLPPRRLLPPRSARTILRGDWVSRVYGFQGVSRVYGCQGVSWAQRIFAGFAGFRV